MFLASFPDLIPLNHCDKSEACLSPLFVAHKSWAEWTSPSTAEYIESHFKWRFCEALPCGWIAFMALWIDELCFSECKQKTPWLFADPYHNARCYHFLICIMYLFMSRSDWKIWLFTHVLLLHFPLNVRDLDTTDLVQHVFWAMLVQCHDLSPSHILWMYLPHLLPLVYS